MKDGQNSNRSVVGWKLSPGHVAYYLLDLELTILTYLCNTTLKDACNTCIKQRSTKSPNSERKNSRGRKVEERHRGVGGKHRTSGSWNYF